MTPFVDELEKLATSKLLTRAALRSAINSFKSGSKKAATSVGTTLRRQFHHGFTGGKTLKPDEESLVQGMKNFSRPVGSLKRAWKEGGGMGKAGIALGAGLDANNIASTRGEDRAGAIGSGIANLAATGALSRGLFLPGMVGYIGAGMIGDKIGRAAGRAVGVKNRVPPKYMDRV